MPRTKPSLPGKKMPFMARLCRNRVYPMETVSGRCQHFPFSPKFRGHPRNHVHETKTRPNGRLIGAILNLSQLPVLDPPGSSRPGYSRHARLPSDA
jgi:hypothetical protein